MIVFALVLAGALKMAFETFEFVSISIDSFISSIASFLLLLLSSMRIVESFSDRTDFVGKEAWPRIPQRKVWPQRPPRKPLDDSNDPLASNIAPVDC